MSHVSSWQTRNDLERLVKPSHSCASHFGNVLLSSNTPSYVWCLNKRAVPAPLFLGISLPALASKFSFRLLCVGPGFFSKRYLVSSCRFRVALMVIIPHSCCTG